MITYGLIGYPLTHSQSAEFFREKFFTNQVRDRQYLLFPLQDPEKIRDLVFHHPDICGLNVTIPLKMRIMSMLDSIDAEAREIGAVNVISIQRDRSRIQLTGHNTDAKGFLGSADFGNHKNALILGTGGGARAVAFALKKSGIRFRHVSRSPTGTDNLDYQDLSEKIIEENTMIINATPLGMYPETGTFPPIPYQFLTGRHFLYDLVYNPRLSLFLQQGAEQKADIQNGMKMLQLQAEYAWKIWEGNLTVR
jgi:shikimate dehydrogenase